MPGCGARLALDVLVDARHDLQQRRLAGAIQAEYADLGAGEEAQADVAQNDALGRHDLANPVHGVYELSHTVVDALCGVGRSPQIIRDSRRLVTCRSGADLGYPA